jgi:hypothetical protein
MKNMRKRYGPRVLSAATALAAVATLSVGAAPAARAATPVPPLVTTVSSIVGDLGSVASYVGYAETAYGLFLQYATQLPKPLTDLQKIQAAITASTAAITAHDDALVNGFVRGCVDDADIALEGITTAPQAAQFAAAAAAVHCVDVAKNEIPVEDKAGVDTLGFALNTVGPVALFLQAYIGQPTDILLQNIVSANQAIVAKLQPTCGVTPNVNVHATMSAYDSANGGAVPGDILHAPIPGHGTCYNYTHPGTHTTDGHVILFPAGVGTGDDPGGTGNDPWTVTGDGVPEICAFGFWCGDHVDWPPVSDHSIAVDQAMATTSYPVAQAALHRLLPAVSGTKGTRVAMASSTSSTHGYEAFRVSPTGKLFTSTLVVGGQAPFWTPVADAPELQSVAAASNGDGRLEVFGINRLGQIFHRWQRTPADDTSWSPWARMDGELNSIAVARNEDGTLQLFGTNKLGNVWTRHQVLGADQGPSWQLHVRVPGVDFWSPWKQMDGSMYQIAAGTDFRLRIELFAIDAHGAMFYRSQNGGSLTDPGAGNWSSWSSMGVKASSIAVTPNSGLSLEVLATMGNTVNQIEEFAPGAFAAPTPVGGSIHGDLAVAKSADGFVVMLALDASGGAFTNVDNGGFVGGWLGWGLVSGPPELSRPVPAAGGKVTLSWTDQSTIEDGFSVFRFKPDGTTMVAMVADLATPNKAGTGETVIHLDGAPVGDLTQQCYKVYAYDYNGIFGVASDLMCR